MCLGMVRQGRNAATAAAVNIRLSLTLRNLRFNGAFAEVSLVGVVETSSRSAPYGTIKLDLILCYASSALPYPTLRTHVAHRAVPKVHFPFAIPGSTDHAQRMPHNPALFFFFLREIGLAGEIAKRRRTP